MFFKKKFAAIFALLDGMNEVTTLIHEYNHLQDERLNAQQAGLVALEARVKELEQRTSVPVAGESA